MKNKGCNKCKYSEQITVFWDGMHTTQYATICKHPSNCVESYNANSGEKKIGYKETRELNSSLRCKKFRFNRTLFRKIVRLFKRYFNQPN